MFAIFKKLSWFFKEQWQRYTLAILFLCLVNILEVIPPKLVGNAIDDMNNGSMTQEGVMKYVIYLLMVLIGSYLFGYLWSYLLFGGGNLVERKLRSGFMGHLLKMTPSFYEKNRTGDLMARATNDLKAISLTAGFGILTLVDAVLFTITVVVMMGATISWQLTIAAVLPLPIMAVLMQIYVKKIYKRFTDAQAAFGTLNDKVLESISGVRVIRAYVQEREDEKRFEEMTEDVYGKNLAVARIDALFDPTISIIIGISYLIGLGYGAYLVFQQAITLGGLVSFNVYLGMLIWPMIAVGELINVMQRGNASLDRVQDTLSYEADVKNSMGMESITNPGNIQFNSVHFTYPSSTVVNLSDISVQLERGQTLGIVGKTGSGKTTFVKQLLREYPLGTGEIAFAGMPLEQLHLEDIRKWIGYVPQDHFLFSKTVRENILFGKMDATEGELAEAIRLADFEKDLMMLPNRLETLVGEKGVALSGGQKQRISIARALIKNPEILILDDSLSAVDAKTETTIIENIQNERAGKTTIITTHRLSAVQHADRIIVLDSGKIIEEGTHADLLLNDGWYSEQYERQQVDEGTEVKA
ncbi:ABC transporter transmembrane domain-containing protein [Peribacillus frigoritolerans]|jgi:ATP-binding cassette, subfamily B, multidrug efflux pump|uniref:ABC transporter ATP-binding protein n=1 Tax=Peribacillus frigoritolerans TaxID=450367 RepID=UPI001EFD5AF5|nr:ABC transporter transmembrane domain-containing protein [Peribacillus frigoritolerans]MCY9003908.1 ATP-binding cassette domain-containing protein [Peribacillus frigoritolerans]MED4631854.1 ABC transporter transmembrane domain-containing protein [Peribacillus frigoritolerans]ULM98227.1 ATP-binding cassette domain-containing protein [Peribacillus frigoritolerans]WHX68076.1 ABC transporter transmembrane domain-containing protein [Peribacillus frigoritolerans]